MSSFVKKILYTAWAIAFLAGVLAALDLVISKPFGGQQTFDICLLVSAALVGYMGFNVLKDQGT